MFDYVNPIQLYSRRYSN